MFDQVFETFRKASESSLHAQQEMFKQWSQQWLSTPSAASAPTQWGTAVQRQWLDLALDVLNKQREAFDSIYRAGIQVFEKSARVSEASSPDDYRNMVEEVLRKLYDTFKEQSESQLRELQKLAEKSFEMVQRV